MFWGEYLHCIDKKGRLIIPARFRPHLCDGAFLTRGLDHNLVIYPHDSWCNLKQHLNEIAMTDSNGRALRRLLFSGAMEISLDRQGRLLIPAYLRDYADLNGNTFVVGMEDMIEIWNPTRWQETLKHATSEASKSSNSLNARTS